MDEHDEVAEEFHAVNLSRGRVAARGGAAAQASAGATRSGSPSAGAGQRGAPRATLAASAAR
ncbi:hypothetical protein GCM10009571_00870 [Agromyces luteolus]